MPQSYSRLQIVLHWLIAILIAVQFLLDDPVGAAWRQMLRSAETRPGLVALMHVYGGILILGLVGLRFVLRLVRGVPQPPAAEPERLRMVARITHWALYGLMALIPLAGLTAWFGRVGVMGEVHEVLANLLLWLVALHVAGALYHQFVLRSNILARMRLARRSAR